MFTAGEQFRSDLLLTDAGEDNRRTRYNVRLYGPEDRMHERCPQ